jgi:hypothetical protein
LSTTPQILEQMHALAEAATEGPEAITMLMGPVLVEAIRPSISGPENQIEVADGIANIKAENPTSDAAYTVTFNATNNVLELRNLTTGESQGIAIGGTAITNGDIQDVEFVGLGITVSLSAAFDKTTDIDTVGGHLSASAGSTGLISSETLKKRGWPI